MYVVDITREDNSTDMLVGNDSMSAKSKLLIMLWIMFLLTIILISIKMF